jgi:integrase
MVEYCRDRNTNSAKSMARSVRSFLRFVHATGRTSAELWGAVPSSSGWHLASLPRAVPAPDLERLLAVAAGSRFSVTGRRDYAILLLLARLGLRRGEVASLRLDDIGWRAGELTVVGKGSRVERLPLPAEPGEAIVAWLTDGRPECETRAVFTTLRPPGRPLSSGAIGHVVGTACRTAGVARIGAHRLRHTLATAMLRSGRRCRRWGRCCATAARCPPRSTPTLGNCIRRARSRRSPDQHGSEVAFLARGRARLTCRFDQAVPSVA